MTTINETLRIYSSFGTESLISREGDGKIQRRLAMAAAQAGTVTSSGGGTAVITFAVAHGIEETDVVGVFWDGGQRIGMTVSAHDTLTISVTQASGLGDAFPADDTAVTVSIKANFADIGFDPTDMQILVVHCAVAAAANFLSSVPASILHVALAAPDTGQQGNCFSWAADTGIANPLDTDVASVDVYNGSTSAADLVVGVLLE